MRLTVKKVEGIITFVVKKVNKNQTPELPPVSTAFMYLANP